MIILQNKIIITLLVLLGISGVCCAQSNSSLSGKVIDDKGNTLSGAYIVLPFKPNTPLIHSILSRKLFVYICKFLYLYIIILADIYA